MRVIYENTITWKEFSRLQVLGRAVQVESDRDWGGELHIEYERIYGQWVEEILGTEEYENLCYENIKATTAEMVDILTNACRRAVQ